MAARCGSTARPRVHRPADCVGRGIAGDGEGVESEEGGLFGDGGLFDVDIPDIPETPDLEAPLDIGGTEFIAGSALGSESMAEHGRNIWGYEMPPLEKVSGYFRDGTYVAEHVRTVKDGVTYNNLRPK